MFAAVVAIRGSGASTVDGGGHGWPDSQRRSDRALGSSARRNDSAVEPVRGRPRPISGAVMGSSAISGWRRYQSSTSRRDRSRRPTSIGSTTSPELVERRLGGDRVHESVEALPERVVAEVRQPRLVGGCRQQLVDPHRSPRTTLRFVAGSCLDFGGRQRGGGPPGLRRPEHQLHQPGQRRRRPLRLELPPDHQALERREVPQHVEDRDLTPRPLGEIELGHHPGQCSRRWASTSWKTGSAGSGPVGRSGSAPSSRGLAR